MEEIIEEPGTNLETGIVLKGTAPENTFGIKINDSYTFEDSNEFNQEYDFRYVLFNDGAYAQAVKAEAMYEIVYEKDNTVIGDYQICIMEDAEKAEAFAQQSTSLPSIDPKDVKVKDNAVLVFASADKMQTTLKMYVDYKVMEEATAKAYVMFLMGNGMVHKTSAEEINVKLFHSILLFTVIGEFFLPWILCRYYDGFNSKTMAMSALGSLQSSVRVIYNTWLIWLGCFLVFVAVTYFFTTRKDFPILSFLLLISLGTFAVGAGMVSGIFHVNESKDIITAASKIHGISAAIGFMALLFFPLLNGILAFKQNKIIFGIICIISFILALIFFICFIMGDKEQFQNTILKYEGLWERLSLLFMYTPLVYKAVLNLLCV